MDSIIDTIKGSVVNGNHNEIEALVKQAIDAGEDLETVVNEALISAMDVVGEKFAANEIYVPEMLVSAMTMKKGLGIIRPLLKEGEAASRGTVVIGTVKGDLHDIGKNLVTMMLEGAGFKVVDLGVDLSVDSVIEQVRNLKPDVLGLSALLTTTMPEMKRVIEVLEEKGLRGDIKVMVGGAPVDAVFAERIGADGYGEDAAAAVKLAKGFVAASV